MTSQVVTPIYNCEISLKSPSGTHRGVEDLIRMKPEDLQLMNEMKTPEKGKKSSDSWRNFVSGTSVQVTGSRRFLLIR